MVFVGKLGLYFVDFFGLEPFGIQRDCVVGAMRAIEGCGIGLRVRVGFLGVLLTIGLDRGQAFPWINGVYVCVHCVLANRGSRLAIDQWVVRGSIYRWAFLSLLICGCIGGDIVP